MHTMKILAAAAASPILLSAVVFASTPDASLTGEPAKAPNRAELFAASDCGLPAFRVAEHVQSWQDALAAKRVHDQALILAKGGTGAAADCETAGR